MNRPFRNSGYGGAALLAQGVNEGMNSFAKNFLDMKRQNTYDQWADLDVRRQADDEAFTQGAYGAQQHVLEGVRGLPDPIAPLTSTQPTAADLASPTHASPLTSPTQPGIVSSQVPPPSIPNQQPAKTSQAPQGSQLEPQVADAYRQAGKASVHQKQIYAQLKGELGGYRQMEQAMARLKYGMADTRSELETARGLYGEGSPEFLKLKADMVRLQSDRGFYEKQLNDFREAVLDVSSHRDPQSGERVVDESGLHDALMMWLDKKTTAGQRAGIEEGVMNRLPGAAVLQRAHPRGRHRPSVLPSR